MSRPTEERIASLPQWARAHIEQQRRKIAGLESWRSPDGDPTSGIFMRSLHGETRWAPKFTRVIVNGVEVTPGEDGVGVKLYVPTSDHLAALGTGGVNSMFVKPIPRG